MTEKDNKKEMKAVIIPENFTRHLHPLNESTNDILLPIASVPYIEYIVEFLLNSGITQIIIILKNNPQSVKDYIKLYFKDLTRKNPKLFHIISNDSFNSFGDCLRELFKESIISSDFVLIRGLTISNFSLEHAISTHALNKKQDKNCLVTSVFKKFKNEYNNKTNYDNNVLITDSKTNRILQYESTDNVKRIKLNSNVKFSTKLNSNSSFEVKSNIYDTFLDICAPEILNHFTDNFDYAEMRDDLYKNYLCSEMYLDTFYYYEIGGNDFCNTVKNMESYLKVTFELINRWAYPLFSLDNISLSQKLGIKYVYTHNNVYLGTGKESTGFTSHLNLARLSSISDFRTSSQAHNNDGNSIQVSADYTTNIAKSVVGSHSYLAPNTTITNSIIGKRCGIGKNTIIKNSVLLEDCEIGENIIIENSVICSRTKVRTGIILIKNSYLGEGLDIHEDNERIDLINRFQIENLRMYNDEENTKNLASTMNKVNENLDNILDSEDEDKSDEICPYTIITQEDFFNDLFGWNLKLNCISKNIISKKDDNSQIEEDNENDAINEENSDDYYIKGNIDNNVNEKEVAELKNEEDEDEFTDSESELDEDMDDFEKPVREIFEKKAEVNATIEELNILRKAYWDNTNAECKDFNIIFYDIFILVIKTYVTWIIDDFFMTVDYDYDDTYYNILVSHIEKWKNLFIKTMTAEEEDQVNLLLAIEKMIETRTYVEEAFDSIVKVFKDLNLLSDPAINTWKALEKEKLGYKTFIEGFINLDTCIHNKLVELI